MVDATRLGAWLRSGEVTGWLAAGTMSNSLYRVPFVYLFLACVFCHSYSFPFFVVFVCVFFSFCSHWSLVDVPLISFCPADHVSDWQPRILLGMVEARSVIYCPGGLSLSDESFPNEDSASASRCLLEGSTKPLWTLQMGSTINPEPLRTAKDNLHCQRLGLWVNPVCNLFLRPS